MPMLQPINLRISRPDPGKLFLTLQAKGDESDSPISRISISWDGQWHDGNEEMRHHLVIEEITQPARPNN